MKNFTYLYIALAVFCISCESWELEKRNDHYFESFCEKYFDAKEIQSHSVWKNHLDEFVIVGQYRDEENSDTDLFLLITDSLGSNPLFKAIGTPFVSETFGDVCLGPNMNIYFAANKNISDVESQIVLYSLNESGTLIQTNEYGFQGAQKVSGICNDQKSIFYLCGFSDSWIGTSGLETIIYEVNNLGNEMAYLRFNVSDKDDKGLDIIFHKEKLYLLYSITEHTKSQLFLLKIDCQNNYNKLWDIKIFDNVNEDHCSISCIEDEIFIFGTFTNNFENSVFVSKVDLTGEIKQSKIYTGTFADNGASVYVNKKGGYSIIAGNSLLIHCNANGEEFFRRELLGKVYGKSSLIIDKDNGFVFSATHQESNSVESLYLMKTDSKGILRASDIP